MHALLSGDLVSSRQMRTRAIMVQRKAARPVQFELLRDARAILLGHCKIENTVRYLGTNVEDALPIAENAEI